MKKNIITVENKKAQITEVRQLEENQERENINHNPLQGITIPKDLDLS